jgi:hypothetical protein
VVVPWCLQTLYHEVHHAKHVMGAGQQEKGKTVSNSEMQAVFVASGAH